MFSSQRWESIGEESAPIGVSAVGDAASPHNVNLTGIGS
jgi:hypothetical protein